jgi:O-acetyl-ADP-ribose deacetylase (regulator of RNase III)
MKTKINKTTIEILQGDITKEKVDAIVNAANNQLSPGGGVSGAIHRAAGPELWKEAKTLGGCKTGEAKITKGYNLPVKYVIHTVGPVYSGSEEDPELLSSCYRESLNLAVKNNLKSVSFPAISTGIFGYPAEPAARVALGTIVDFVKNNSGLELVRMVLFDKKSFEIHVKVLQEITAKK